MRILVDADACPVKEIVVRAARARHIPVTMLIDTSHELDDGYSTVVTVDKQKDSVDFALMNRLTKNDIVVTQDYGLAAMVLGKGARVLDQNGRVYTDDNIENLLMDRTWDRRSAAREDEQRGRPNGQRKTTPSLSKRLLRCWNKTIRSGFYEQNRRT